MIWRQILGPLAHPCLRLAYGPKQNTTPANGKIYVIGGLDSGFVEQSQTWEYDPVTNT
jgi:hypothetical protein